MRGEVERGAVQQLLGERVWPGGPQVLVLPLLDGHAYPESAVGRGYPTREAARPQFQPYGRVVGPEVGEGDQEVQDVEVLRRRKLRKSPPLADGRVTTVGADNEVRWEIVRPVWVVGPHPDDPVLCPDQVPNRGTHVELEGRVLSGLLGEHGEDCRLGDEPGDEAQRLGCDPGSPPA